MKDFLGQLQKDHGEEIGNFGGTLVNSTASRPACSRSISRSPAAFPWARSR